MPDINSIPEVLYNPLDPYHWTFDNLPLKNIQTRLELINSAVDINSNILRNSIGTAGTLAGRLSVSLQETGELKAEAVDNTFHNIAYHTDGSIVVDGEPVDFVRMLLAERDKLELISDEATALSISFPGISDIIVYSDENVNFSNSDTVTWTVLENNVVQAHLAFPPTAAHRHYYDIIPVSADIITPDHINYKTTSVATPFMEGSLRVYVNGIKLSESSPVFVYDASLGTNDNWLATYYSSDYTTGTFALNRAISTTDTITIDFDVGF